MFQYVLLLFAEASLACFSSNGGSAPPPEPEPDNDMTVALLKHLNKLQGGSSPAFNGFQIPDNITQQWMDWLAEYKAKKQQLIDETKDYYQDGGPGGGIPGWPENWKGLHKGDEGFPPYEVPPWGFKAKNLGLPAVCYLAAKKGNCGGNTIRWGFNAHMQECMKFEYSGCGGNSNNFDTELACYDKCTKPVSGGCDMETDIPVQGMSIAGYTGDRRCGNAVKEIDTDMGS